MEVDVTTAVRSWLSDVSNNGFVIQGADEAATRQVNVLFASMETGFQPELVITTGEEPPPPPLIVEKHTRPEVQLTRSVAKNVTLKKLVIRGKTRGSDRITKVRYRVGNGPYRTASGTSKWKFSAKLAMGKNLIRIVAKDKTGDTSKILKLRVDRKIKPKAKKK